MSIVALSPPSPVITHIIPYTPAPLYTATGGSQSRARRCRAAVRGYRCRPYRGRAAAARDDAHARASRVRLSLSVSVIHASRCHRLQPPSNQQRITRRFTPHGTDATTMTIFDVALPLTRHLALSGGPPVHALPAPRGCGHAVLRPRGSAFRSIRPVDRSGHLHISVRHRSSVVRHRTSH